MLQEVGLVHRSPLSKALRKQNGKPVAEETGLSAAKPIPRFKLQTNALKGKKFRRPPRLPYPSWCRMHSKEISPPGYTPMVCGYCAHPRSRNASPQATNRICASTEAVMDGIATGKRGCGVGCHDYNPSCRPRRATNLAESLATLSCGAGNADLRMPLSSRM